jgi:two-component system, sensor histidine kinase YesM
MTLFTSLINTIKEHFRLKLIICFITCAILPLLILGTISYKISYSIAKSNILKETKISCEKNQAMLENRMTQIENLADSIHLNLCVLCSTPEQPVSKYLDTLSSVRNNITSMADSFHIYHINIFLPDDSFASNEGLTFCPLSAIENYNVQLSDFTNQGIAPKWIFRKQITFPYMVSKNENPSGVFSCYRSAQVNSQYYCFAIHITSDELGYYLNRFPTDNPSLSYIVDTKGIILSSTDEKLLGTSLPDEKLNAIANNMKAAHFSYDNCEVISVPVHDQLFLVTETPHYYIRESSSILVKMIFICFMIIVPLTMFSIIYVADQMTNKINRLSHSMAEINMNDVIDAAQINNLVPSSSTHLDEIDTLTVTCANMISELNSSFENNLHLKIQEEKLNYQLLQSQINPHFLYNILASVQNLLSLGEISKADKMLSDLSRFYRGLLRTSNDLIPIKKELEIAQLYMEMEVLCKDNLFDWDIYLEDGIENFLICKFTLQPILENAIQHGLKGNGTHMHIHISITYDDDMIEILISDNGVGISAEKLNEIQESIESKHIHYEKHFGISNINSRINSSLQGHGTLRIESSKDSGTTIYIRIPQLLEDD